MSSEAMTSTKAKARVNVRKMAQVAMLGAIAVVLMLFEIPLPFAPSFYEIDFSEVPVLVGCFTMGPLAGVAIELVKILLNLVINGTATAGVGELANFLIGCALVLPAAIIYKRMHTRKGAIIGMATGTIFMTVVGCFLNAFLLLPTYAVAFGMPIEGLVEMGTAVHSSVNSLLGFVALIIVPFNLVKYTIVSVIVFFVYKRIRVVLRGD